jgi:cytochrome c2
LFSCATDSSEQENETFSNSVNNKEIIQKGNVLFATNCKVCHAFDKNQASGLAPVLENIKQNWPDKSLLTKYIKNAPALMQENKRTRKLYQEWKNKASMPVFPGLSDEEVNCIIEYLYTNS